VPKCAHAFSSIWIEWWGRQICISKPLNGGYLHFMATTHGVQQVLPSAQSQSASGSLGPACSSLPHVRKSIHIQHPHPSKTKSNHIKSFSEKHRELMNFLIFAKLTRNEELPWSFLWHFVLPRCYQLVFVSGLVFKLSRIQWSVGRFTAWIISQLKTNS